MEREHRKKANTEDKTRSTSSMLINKYIKQRQQQVYTSSRRRLERSRSPGYPYASRRQDANYAMVPSGTPWIDSRGAISKCGGTRRRGRVDEARQAEAISDHHGGKAAHPQDRGMIEDVVLVRSMSCRVVFEVHMNDKHVVWEEGVRQEHVHGKWESLVPQHVGQSRETRGSLIASTSNGQKISNFIAITFLAV
jgi:hypothetical protein